MLRLHTRHRISSTVLIIAAAMVAAVGVGIAVSLPATLQGSERDATWGMTGHDVNNTRSQPLESQISRQNVARLAPKWVLTTNGDVSATPAVGSDGDNGDDRDGRGGRDDRRHSRRDQFVYFPDWGGQLWKVNAETGQVQWSRSIASYNGIAGSLSRTSPVLANGLVYVADLNGNMIAVDARSGDLRWITEMDPHPGAIVTASPVIRGNRLYANVSSNESSLPRTIPGYVCCSFRGSTLALDAKTGKIIWQSFVVPDNGGEPGGYAGGAFVNPPAIDEVNGLVYGGAGNFYSLPASASDCLAAANDGWDESCFSKDAHFNSVVAFDIRTGAIRWSFRGAGLDAWKLACGNQPSSVTWCPAAATATSPAIQFSIWDFAGSGVNVFSTEIKGRQRNVVGIGQKSGVYWALDARTGKYLWSTLVGPGSDPGGIQWGSAFDGRKIYAAIGHNTGEPYTLPNGMTITGGSWAALEPWSGKVLWQTADPSGSPDLAALSEANGVLYAGSMEHTGDQMYALNTTNGEILWRFAAGGSVAAGPAIVDETVYWGSGYARTGGVGNNKFYAFSVDGR